MSWDAIGLVTSGLTLAAFIGALIAFVARQRIGREKKLIEQAPDADRASLVMAALEFFDVDTGNLTKQQQYDIAIKQIDNRSRRFSVTSIVIVVLAVLLLLGSIYALTVSSTSSETAKDAADAADDSRKVADAIGVGDGSSSTLIESEIDGIWGEDDCNVRYEFVLEQKSLAVTELATPEGTTPIQFLFIDAKNEDKLGRDGAKQSVMTLAEKRGLNPGSAVKFTLTDHGTFQSLVWDSLSPNQGTLELNRCDDS